MHIICICDFVSLNIFLILAFILQVDNLKEENVTLRKKIASIKKRHGLPLNVSVMTKVETERCMAEIMSLTLTGEVTHHPGISKDGASSTSTLAPQHAGQTMGDSTQSHWKPPASSGGRESVRNKSPSLDYGASVYGPSNPSSVPAPVPVQQTMDDLTKSSRETPASSGGRKSVRNQSPSLKYRASVYGHFNPSSVSEPVHVRQTMDDLTARPREAPASSRKSVQNESPSLNYGASVYGPFNPSPSWPPVAMPPLYASSSVLNYPPWAGHSQGSSIEREIMERSIVPHNYFVHKGMPGLGPAPFGYYVQYKSDKNQMYYSSSSDDDAAMNHSKGHRKQKGASKGQFNNSLHKRGVMAGELCVSATPQFVNTAEQGSCTGDAAVDLSSSGRVQSQFSGPFKIPLPTTLFRNRYTQPAETTTSDGQNPCSDPEKEFLSQENAQLKGTIQTLMKEMEELKAAVHKDQPRGHP